MHTMQTRSRTRQNVMKSDKIAIWMDDDKQMMLQWGFMTDDVDSMTQFVGERAYMKLDIERERVGPESGV